MNSKVISRYHEPQEQVSNELQIELSPIYPLGGIVSLPPLLSTRWHYVLSTHLYTRWHYKFTLFPIHQVALDFICYIGRKLNKDGELEDVVPEMTKYVM